MLGIDFSNSSNIIALIVIFLILVHTLFLFILHNKREKYFKLHLSDCAYAAILSLMSGFIVGMTFIFSYVVSYQVLNHIIDKMYLLHLIYLVPLFVLNLYLLLKSYFFRMKLENGYLIIRNAVGITSKYNIYQIKYTRKFGIFTILYTDKKRKLLIQSAYLLYNLDHILDILHKHK